jgi:xanthine dehydrogenase/oxidase
MGSDIYGMAALKAARTIKERLAPFREQNPGASWKDIVNKAYLNRVDLSAQGFFTVRENSWKILMRIE